jgi:hypothetical protein
VEPEKSTAIKRPVKHIPAATNTQETTEELLKTVFYFVSAPRLYSEDPAPAERMMEESRKGVKILEFSFEEKS